MKKGIAVGGRGGLMVAALGARGRDCCSLADAAIGSTVRYLEHGQHRKE